MFTTLEQALDSVDLGRGERKQAERSVTLLDILSTETIADRSEYVWNSGKGKAIAGCGDLIAAIIEETVNIDELEEEKLSARLRERSPEDRGPYIRKQILIRQKVKADLDRLHVQRENHMAEQRALRESRGDDDVFTLSAFQIIEEKVEEYGFTIEK